MGTVNFSDLETALEYSSIDVPCECLAYIDLQTGATILVSGDMPDDIEVPADVDSSDRHLPVPDKKDPDLGNRLAFRFVHGHLPDDYDTVSGYFRKSGAYGRFKDMLNRRGALEAWHAFEKQKTEEALKQWCEENDIQLLRLAGGTTITSPARFPFPPKTAGCRHGAGQLSLSADARR